MTIRYLLDTNILSEPLKPKPDLLVMENIKYHQYEIATAAPVFYELIRGAYRMKESKKQKKILNYIDLFVSSIPILPYEKKAASWHGKEMSRLQKLGLTPAFLDSQIASIAKANDLILVTRNITDFENFLGLSLENWFSNTST
jgi:tRNA(fMet)-specific endonuclease VapC